MRKKPIAPKIFVPFDQRPQCETEGCSKTAQLQSNSKATGLPIWRKVNGKFACTAHHSQTVAAKRGLESMALVIAANAGFNTVEEYQLDKAKKAGYDNVTDYNNSLSLARAQQAGYDNVTDYNNSLTLARALEAGYDNITDYNNSLSLARAQQAGYDNIIDYNNSRHRYRCNRLDYCQNCAGEAVWVDPDTGEHKPLHDEIELCTYTISKGRLGQAMLSVDHINGNNNDDRPENHQTLCHNCHKAKSLLSNDHWSCEKKRKHLEKMLGSSASTLVFG